MRRFLYILAALLVGLGSQVAVLYTAVLLARSPAFDRFRSVGPGSVGDLLLVLALVLALEAVLAAVLAAVLWRRRRKPAVLISVLVVSALIGVFACLGLGLA